MRDPVALVLSGYNYHRQVPAPEDWIDSRLASSYPCGAADWRRLRPACVALAATYGSVVPDVGPNGGDAASYGYPTISYGALLADAPERDGLLLEFYRTVIGGRPDMSTNRMMATWPNATRRQGADVVVTLTSMAAYYAAPARVLRCILDALDMPERLKRPHAVDGVVSALADDLARERRKGRRATGHVTAGKYNATLQEALLLGDAAARETLLAFRAEVGRAFRDGPATCGAAPGSPVYRR